MKTVLGVEPGAVATFSDDELHRYSLERIIDSPTDGSVRVLFCCGLNPSTADAFKLDPTVRREIGFGRSWGCTHYLKGNAYSWRDTKPDDMWDAERNGELLVTVDTDILILDMLLRAKNNNGIALACWGKPAQRDRVRLLVAMAKLVGIEWQCLGTNKDGSPCHPLYLHKDTQLRPWKPAA